GQIPGHVAPPEKVENRAEYSTATTSSVSGLRVFARARAVLYSSHAGLESAGSRRGCRPGRRPRRADAWRGLRTGNRERADAPRRHRAGRDSNVKGLFLTTSLVDGGRGRDHLATVFEVP